MAKLQIPIDDELMHQLKVLAVLNGTTLKNIVTKALEDAINPTTTTRSSTSNTPTTFEDEDYESYVEPSPFGDDYIIDPHIKYDESITRDDVDPLGMMTDEEVEAKLREVRQYRG